VPSALYQDIRTNPGDFYVWSLAHRGRAGDGIPNSREPRSQIAELKITKTGPAKVTAGGVATVTITNHGAGPGCRPSRR
jgi:hypothetical protein